VLAAGDPQLLVDHGRELDLGIEVGSIRFSSLSTMRVDADRFEEEPRLERRGLGRLVAKL